MTANAVVDGREVYTGMTKVDASGNCAVAFPLPKDIARGDGTLSLAVDDGGVVEPIAKTIPILLQTVDLAVYPEGGDLVAGLPCRVYLEARTVSGKPADLVGSVMDSHGSPVASVKTEHEGRGRFDVHAQGGRGYALKISQPAGIDKAFPLPAVKAEGVGLRSDADVVEQGRGRHAAPGGHEGRALHGDAGEAGGGGGVAGGGRGGGRGRPR